MTTTDIVNAAANAMANLQLFGNLGPAVRLEMCHILKCNPADLDAALNDEDTMLACLGY
jgi:DNA-binding Xre family transcriptional regulator